MSYGAGVVSRVFEILGTMPWWSWVIVGLVTLYGIALAIWKHMRDQGAL